MKKSKALSIVLAAALVVSSISVSQADAKEKPYKPTLSKKNVTVETGSKVKIRLKNAKKVKKTQKTDNAVSNGKRTYKYTVKWSVNKKKIAKISNKRSKGKKSYAVIKGITPGKATLKAKVYRFGKKMATIKCKITVVSASVQPTATTQPTDPAATSPAIVTQAPTAEPDVTATPDVTRTPRPTSTPSPVPTATPTHVPNTQPPVEKPWPEGAKSYDVNLEDTISSFGDSTWVVNSDGSITVTFAGSYPDVSFTVPEADRIPDYYKWVEIVYSDSDGNRGLSIYDKNINWDAPWESDATTKYDMGPEFLPEWAGDCVCIVPYSDLEDWNEYMTRLDIYAPTFDGGSSNNGHITIKSIKMYSDEVGPIPTPTSTPDYSKEYTVDFSNQDVCKDFPSTTTVNSDGSITINATGKGEDHVIQLPEEIAANGYTKVTIEYEITSGAFSCKYYDQTTGTEHWDYNDEYNFNSSATSKTVTFAADAVPVDKLVLFDLNSAGTMNIKSIVFSKDAESAPVTVTPTDVKVTVNDSEVDAYEYKIPATSDDMTVTVKNTTNYGPISFNVADLTQYVDEYEYIWDFVKEVSDKTGGSITKYLGENGSITYTATEENKGTIEFVNGDIVKNATVEFTKNDETITVNIVSPAYNVTLSVNASDKNKVYATKNGISGYLVELTKNSDGYDVIVTTPAGNVFKVAKNVDEYTILATKDFVAAKGIEVEYVVNE